MPLFTRKEYNNGNKTDKKDKRQRAKGQPEKVPEPAKPTWLYVLLHPELPMNGYLQFSDFIMVGNERVPRVCRNGVVETMHEGLKDFLVGKGYELLDKKEVENDLLQKPRSTNRTI